MIGPSPSAWKTPIPQVRGRGMCEGWSLEIGNAYRGSVVRQDHIDQPPILRPLRRKPVPLSPPPVHASPRLLRWHGLTPSPVKGVEEIVRPKDEQQTAFENLKQASAQAADQLRTSCPAQTAATPVARLDAASNRLQALVQAAKTVRPTLGAFYASLDDEQKARFNNMGQQNSTRSESATGIR
jgi:hypothetical protein